MSKPEDSLNLEGLAGYRWLENGQSALNGNLLELFRRLDRLFLSWASECDASEYRFPTFISARDLARLDYFRSFPHLVTFPVVLKSEEENLKRFSEGATLNPEGEVALTDIGGVKDVLTPAACYHFYGQFRGQELQSVKYVTTRANCFRHEAYYSPLQRQWSFSMREIVCLGTADEVKDFLSRYQEKCQGFFNRIGLPVQFQNATDPFFNPSKNPKYILQKLDPVKTEMVYQTGLAIGSINFHRNYFGEAFEISRDNKEAFSGCVAFGLERWIYAVLHQFGFEEDGWPRLE